MGVAILSIAGVLTYLALSLNDKHSPIKLLLWASIFYFMILALRVVGLGADELGFTVASNILGTAYSIIIWFWYLLVAYVVWVYAIAVINFIRNIIDKGEIKIW